MSDCKYCKEDNFNHIEKVEIVFHHENPQAYGYPEVCNWKKKYNADCCPACGRKLEHLKAERSEK